jgi:hypothetical protein
MKYLKYLWYVIKHKWFVFIECAKCGIIWRGIVHDLSKFRPSEFFAYANHFYGSKEPVRDKTGYYKPTDTGDSAFDYAWFLHQKRNPHHWQYWIMPDINKHWWIQAYHPESGPFYLANQKHEKIAMFADYHYGPCDGDGTRDEDYANIKQVTDILNMKSIIHEMPDVVLLEMVCDWKGAGRAQGFKGPNECIEWYQKNKDKMILNDQTRSMVEKLLGIK